MLKLHKVRAVVIAALYGLGVGCTSSAFAAASCIGNVADNPCSPGNGAASNCAAEWLLTPQPPRDRKLIPINRVTCIEGDASCDFDSEADVCTFEVALCINNTDPRLPFCVPTWLEYLEVKQPRLTSRDLVDAINRSSLESLTRCGPGGVCIPLVRGGAVVTGPERTDVLNSSRNMCSDAVKLRVPLRKRLDGTAVKTRRSFALLTKVGGPSDRDRLRFECQPGSCGNGILETVREQCDDGNRVNGDGCDVSCRIESASPTPSPSATAVPTLTLTPSSTGTPPVTATATFTRTLLPTPTASTSPSLSPTFSSTPTATPTHTVVPSPSSTSTSQPTATYTVPSSITPTPSASVTRTAPPSATMTIAWTLTPTSSFTAPPTATATTPPPTASPTPSPTLATPQPCNPDSESYSEPAFYRSLAYRWAPLIMQDTASKWNADFIGKVNYDNDWRSNNNWDNLPSAGIAPYLYYDVLETSTHWFIHYHTYHPRDWDNVFFGTCAPASDCHENDTENILVMVQKDGSTYGRFRLLETRAHNDFYQYAFANDGIGGGSGANAEDIDNDAERGFSLFTDTSVGVTEPRPAIYIESKGHGICDWWDNNGPYCTHSDDTVPGGDGVMYYPSQTATPSVPANPNGGQWYNFKSPYNLISIWDDVWVLRSCMGDGLTFDNPFTYPGVNGNGSASVGQAMDGDDYSSDAGTAWWAQSDSSNNLEAGAWTFDPAGTVLRQLTFSEQVDRTYTFNPFLGVR